MSLKHWVSLYFKLDFSKQNGVSVNFRTSLRRLNAIYTRATFSRTKTSAKWSATAATHSSVTSCMQIRAQFRLFQVKAMFKQHVNLMIWAWILRLQTPSRNEFPWKNWIYATGERSKRHLQDKKGGIRLNVFLPVNKAYVPPWQRQH